MRGDGFEITHESGVNLRAFLSCPQYGRRMDRRDGDDTRGQLERLGPLLGHAEGRTEDGLCRRRAQQTENRGLHDL